MTFSSKQLKKLKELARKYQLKLVVLFGSQVSGKTHQESDFDIGFLSKKELSFKKEIQLASKFIEIFGEKVDVTNLRKASPLLLREVAENACVLYQEKKDEFDRFQLYALQRYAEAKPIFEMHQEAIKQFLSI